MAKRKAGRPVVYTEPMGRIELRVPESFKQAVQDAANHEGQFINLFIIDRLSKDPIVKKFLEEQKTHE